MRWPTSGERASHLVYIDALVPDDGDTVIGMTGGPRPPAMALAQDWLVPPTPRRYDDPDEAAFADPRRSPQPIGRFTEPVRRERPLESFGCSLTDVKATADGPDAPAADVFWSAADRARTSPSWSYREIATNHMIANNRPGELAEILLALSDPN